MDFLFKNIAWSNEGKNVTADVRISKGIISGIGNLSPLKKERAIDFQNHFLYPGLINSHDHLEMNLYPLMGNPPYNNYTEWARDIYKPKESPVKEIESIDLKDRLMWGGIKNLISGATTVVHHNPWHRLLSKEKFPVRVVEIAWAHSMAFEKKVDRKFPKKNRPFVIHAAEGVDEFARDEIQELNRRGLLKPNTVLIHAIALNQFNINLIEQASASVIWCPSSNLFMFNKTSPIEEIKRRINVALGTDSTMTGPATLFDEMRVASNSHQASSKEIYDMVTSVPAKVFFLDRPEIKVGQAADFFISPKNHQDYFENVFSLDPSTLTGVFISGELRFGTEDLANAIGTKGFELNFSENKRWIAYDVSSLRRRIEKKAKGACHENSLWKKIARELN